MLFVDDINDSTPACRQFDGLIEVKYVLNRESSLHVVMSSSSDFHHLIEEALRYQSSDLPRALASAEAAYETADPHDAEQVSRAAITLGALLRMRGIYEDAERLLKDGLRDAPVLAVRLSGLIQLGQVYLERGMKAEAIESFECALTELDGNDLPDKLAAIHLNLGNVHSVDDPDLALTHYSNALQDYTRLGDEIGMATVLANTGVLAQQQGRHEEAILTFVQASRILHSLGEERLRAIALHRIAISHLELGDHSQALNDCEAALEIANKQKLISLTAEILATKADATQGMGSNELAAELREESRALIAHLRMMPHAA